MKLKWSVCEDMNDDDENPTGWASEINHPIYGRFVWITLHPNGYAVECERFGECETLIVCKSLASAKRWVSMNLV